MNARFLVACLLAATVVAGCGAGDAGSARLAGTTAPPPKPGEPILTDPLDDDTNRWGVGDDDLGKSSFEGGGYRLEIRGAPLLFGFPDVLAESLDRSGVDLTEVVVEATVVMEQTGEVAGVFCRGSAGGDADLRWYEFMVRDGFATIRIADNRERVHVLAKTDQLALPAGKPVAVQGACVDGDGGRVRLSLTVNGTPVLQTLTEDRLPEGVVGIGVYPAPGSSKHNPTVVRFEHFEVSRPA